MKRTVAALAAIGLFVGGWGSAGAQQKWTMPTPYADGNYHSVNIKQFAGDVRKDSGGKLEISVHTGASLMKLPEIKRAVQLGQVQIGGQWTDLLRDIEGEAGIQYLVEDPQQAALESAIGGPSGGADFM